MAAEGLESTVFTLECRYILAGLGDILMGRIKQEREILKGRGTPYSKLLNSFLADQVMCFTAMFPSMKNFL